MSLRTALLLVDCSLDRVLTLKFRLGDLLPAFLPCWLTDFLSSVSSLDTSAEAGLLIESSFKKPDEF